MRLCVAAAAIGLLVGCGNTSAEATAAEAAATSSVQSGAWTVDYDQSSLGFEATQNGKVFDGKFDEFEASIVLDPSDLVNASIDVSIAMDSAQTGDRQRDSALPGTDWFDAKSHPTARFVSTSVRSVGENAYEAAGALTIRGVTNDVTLPFALVIEDNAAKAEGRVTIMRDAFGVGRGEFKTGTWVGLSVDVVVDITASR